MLRPWNTPYSPIKCALFISFMSLFCHFVLLCFFDNVFSFFGWTILHIKHGEIRCSNLKTTGYIKLCAKKKCSSWLKLKALLIWLVGSICSYGRKNRLTAFIVDNTLLCLLSVELAEWAVLGILFDISLSRPHPHPAGHAAGRPADPLWHHARRGLCPAGRESRRPPTCFSYWVNTSICNWAKFSVVICAQCMQYKSNTLEVCFHKTS